jgi:hypothetical protein
VIKSRFFMTPSSIAGRAPSVRPALLRRTAYLSRGRQGAAEARASPVSRGRPSRSAHPRDTRRRHEFPLPGHTRFALLAGRAVHLVSSRSIAYATDGGTARSVPSRAYVRARARGGRPPGPARQHGVTGSRVLRAACGGGRSHPVSPHASRTCVRARARPRPTRRAARPPGPASFEALAGEGRRLPGGGAPRAYVRARARGVATGWLRPASAGRERRCGDGTGRASDCATSSTFQTAVQERVSPINGSTSVTSCATVVGATRSSASSSRRRRTCSGACG